MSDIRESINQLPEPEKSIGNILIEYYDTMKSLERDKDRGGKQAVKIVMTTHEIEKIMQTA